MQSSTTRQPPSLLYIFAMAASRRMSFLPRRRAPEEMSLIGLHGEGVAAMRAQHLRDGVVLADGRAPLLPLGRPDARHLQHHFAPYAAVVGSVRRPVLSVVSASLSPFPSPQSTFSRGTRTFVKRMTAFSMPLQPHEVEAVRVLHALPRVDLDDEGGDPRRAARLRDGVRAITTMSSAMGRWCTTASRR
jgi:hypothetical protein